MLSLSQKALFVLLGAMLGATTSGQAGQPLCALSAGGLDETLALPRSQLMHGRTLTIVAIGSSSTEGAGASSADGS